VPDFVLPGNFLYSYTFAKVKKTSTSSAARQPREHKCSKRACFFKLLSFKNKESTET
jgi:hypothetical protein